MLSAFGLIFTVAATLLGCVSAHIPVPCLDNDGNSVDWWVALKFPGGGTYSYIDARSQVNSSTGAYDWTVAYGLDEPSGNALAHTLLQLYNTSADVGYAMWNDEFPSGLVWFGGAHAKGLLGLGVGQGFWLTHSAPKFPMAPCSICPDGGQGYSGIATAQQVYGQSFACVTAPASHLDGAAAVAGTSGVYLYDYHVPATMRGAYPAAEALMTAAPYGRPAYVPGAPPIVSGAPFESPGGQAFALFAKAASLLQLPLYEVVVEPHFRSAMVWESWQHGENLPQDCGNGGMNSSFSSFTVAEVAVPNGASWEVGQDHSKWGVTSVSPPFCCHRPASGSPLGNAVCIADLNRQWHQNFRGGGAICFVGNDALWRAFSSIITALQPCLAAA